MFAKAIVPMAGLGTRLYPASAVIPKGLMPFATADGALKTGLQLIVETLLAAGIQQVGVVVSPETRAIYETFLEGGGAAYASARAQRPSLQATYTALQQLRRHITLIEQPQPLGLGHAVWCAATFAQGEPVVVVLGDHLWLPLGHPTPVLTAMELSRRYHAPVYGVHRVPIHKVALYGILQGEAVEAPHLYQVRQICEKPTPEYARAHLHTEGLAPDEFFAHNGIYAFPPTLWEILAQIATQHRPEAGEWTLTAVQQRLLAHQPAYLYEANCAVLDFGTVEGYRHAFCTIANCQPNV
ncbi:MAG: sugar phosphate nucleotidyltransferase [Fimbriimonadales bacterium]|nr:sugar phosphate nucleotidyltransferase [Fimbriimonadales bacterium]MDW8051117.1 sugar phosphate nucleotidyltransferase [Armatimonadota bacterium]